MIKGKLCDALPELAPAAAGLKPLLRHRESRILPMTLTFFGLNLRFRRGESEKKTGWVFLAPIGSFKIGLSGRFEGEAVGIT